MRTRLIMPLIAVLIAAAPAHAGSDGPVVFLGASVIRFWKLQDPSYFAAHPDYIVRGNNGESTRGTLRRTPRDILPLHPSVVVIMPTGNDNGFAIKPAESRDNLKSIAGMVRAQGGKVVILGSSSPSPVVDALVADYARAEGIPFVSLAALHAPEGGQKPELTLDGAHPNQDGYRAIEPAVTAAIEAVRASR
jgi:lysophospholipase L1-like esterase